MVLLRPGCFDRERVSDRPSVLGPYHDWNLPNRGYRADVTGKWWGFKPLDGSKVHLLQNQLSEIGFYRKGKIDGVYGYRTRSSVRLFQEYVRVIEDHPEIGSADGLVGDTTQSHIDRWVRDEIRPAWRRASPEYKEAMEGLRQLKESFAGSNLKGVRLLNRGADGSSSRAVADWTYDTDAIHLVGIRRNENEVFADAAGGLGRRRNDDLFILLVKGMRMVFRGSTNPSPRAAQRRDQAFLLRGQHEYRFGWHKVSGTQGAPQNSKVYRAFKPRVAAGPLVVRAVGDLLTEQSFENAAPNNGINIHWSGAGARNWSAGCQVIAGRKYIDFRNELVDLSDRAASGYADLSGKKTRGAYNVLVDAITMCAGDITTSGDRILYTLLYERDVKRTRAGAPIDYEKTIARLS